MEIAHHFGIDRMRVKFRTILRNCICSYLILYASLDLHCLIAAVAAAVVWQSVTQLYNDNRTFDVMNLTCSRDVSRTPQFIYSKSVHVTHKHAH